MKVREVMERLVVSVSPQTTYEEAAKIMHRHGFSGLPVVDSTGKLVGILSEKDLFRALYPHYEDYARKTEEFPHGDAEAEQIEEVRKNSISSYMTKGVLSVEADAPLMKAGGMMLARGIHRLPVTENGQMIGIVTREQIYGAILEHHLSL
jgi:CBS domain-containing protein